MTRRVEISSNGLKQMQEGVNILADVVKSTLGPVGRTVIIESDSDYAVPVVTKDGVTVAKSVMLLNKLQNIAVKLVKQAAAKTAEKAGDGTTTSIVLAQALINLGMEREVYTKRFNVIKQGMLHAVSNIIDVLDKNTIKIETAEDVYQVALISSNGDVQIAESIKKAFEQVGKTGIINVEYNSVDKDRTKVFNGYTFDRGFLSYSFINKPERGQVHINDPKVLIVNEKIRSSRFIVPIINLCIKNDFPLVIMCDDMEGDALATCVQVVQKGLIPLVVVKNPSLDSKRKLILKDIATFTGGTVIAESENIYLEDFQLEMLGSCQKFECDKEDSVIIGGKGEFINELITTLTDKLENGDNTEYEKEFLEERIAKLNKGMATIYVSGFTESEMEEKKYRVEDAILAVKSALADGVVAGGGTAYLKAFDTNFLMNESYDDYKLGLYLVYQATLEPYRTLVINSEVENKIDIIVADEDANRGQDFNTGLLCNLQEQGIIDPVKVTKIALQNAVSVAISILGSRGIVYPIGDIERKMEDAKLSKELEEAVADMYNKDRLFNEKQN
jgi:chaperonin GroEL